MRFDPYKSTANYWIKVRFLLAHFIQGTWLQSTNMRKFSFSPVYQACMRCQHSFPTHPKLCQSISNLLRCKLPGCVQRVIWKGTEGSSQIAVENRFISIEWNNLQFCVSPKLLTQFEGCHPSCEAKVTGVESAPDPSLYLRLTKAS